MSNKKKDKSSHIPIDILSEVLKCCQSIGGDSTLLILKQAQEHGSSIEGVSSMIIEIVCKELKVNKHTLFGGGSYGNKTIATMFVFIFHKAHLGYDINKLELLFNQKYKTIWASIKRFDSLSKDHREDLRVLKQFNSINEIIITKINEYRTK